MTYARYSKITASDYNNLATSINNLYSIGNADTGLGQTAIPELNIGKTVDNSDWNLLRTPVNNLINHQGTSSSLVPIFNEGDLISFVSSLDNGVTNTTTYFGNASAQGVSATTTTTTSNTWTDSATFTHVITFESGDKARYFFNAGGQIAINFSKSGSQPVDNMWQNLITNMGTLVLSGGGKYGNPVHSIVGTNYYGFTQISGSSSASVNRVIYQTSLGYYQLDTTNTILYKQTVPTVAMSPDYLTSNISVSAKTNGTQGVNNDNGSTIILTTLWDEQPNNLTNSAGTTVTVTVKPPNTTNITNTWGTVSVSGTVNTL